MPDRAGRRSTAEWASSRKGYQVFSLPHGLDKLPSETVGELDILITTNRLVSKKRTHGILDQHRSMSESTEHTISETRSLSPYLMPLPQWSLLDTCSASLTQLSIYPEQEGIRDSVKVHHKTTLATLGNLPTGPVHRCFVFNQ